MNLLLPTSLNFIHSPCISHHSQTTGSQDDCLSPVKSNCSIFDPNPQDSALNLHSDFCQRDSLKSIQTNCTDLWEENDQDTQSSFYSTQNSLQTNSQKPCPQFHENGFCPNGNNCLKGVHHLEWCEFQDSGRKMYVMMQNFPQILIGKDKRVRSFLSE